MQLGGAQSACVRPWIPSPALETIVVNTPTNRNQFWHWQYTLDFDICILTLNTAEKIWMPHYHVVLEAGCFSSPSRSCVWSSEGSWSCWSLVCQEILGTLAVMSAKESAGATGQINSLTKGQPRSKSQVGDLPRHTLFIRVGLPTQSRQSGHFFRWHSIVRWF